MSALTVQRVLRPYNLATIFGSGVFAVAAVSLLVASAGATLPITGEIVAALIGIYAGAKSVLVED